LVKATAEAYANAAANESGLLRATTASVLGLEVTREQLERALLIYDSIIKALESQGHSVALTEISGKPPRTITEAKVFGEGLEVKLYDMGGRLRFSVENYIAWGTDWLQRNWTDRSNSLLERNLNGIMRGLYRIAEVVKEQRLDREKRARKEQEEAARKCEEQRRQQLQANRLKGLDEMLKGKQRAQQIRELIAELEHTRAKLGIQSDAEFEDWKRWAFDHADSMDPIACLKTGKTPVPPEEPEPAPKPNHYGYSWQDSERTHPFPPNRRWPPWRK
jgi:hypothetical protein